MLLPGPLPLLPLTLDGVLSVVDDSLLDFAFGWHGLKESGLYLIILIQGSMSIFANVVPEARDISNCLAVMESITTPLMALLINYKDYLVDATKQTDALYASSLKVFQALHKQSKKQLSVLEKRKRPQPSVQRPVKRSVSPLPAAIAHTSRNSVKIPCVKLQPTLSSKMVKELKGSEKMPKTFICFICFRSRYDPDHPGKNYSWQAESFYLSHLDLEHGIVPNFQVALLSVTSISFSHAYFHGQLVNLFANSPLQEYMQMLACFRQDPASSRIYICACITKGDICRRIQDEPVFISSSTFYDHIAEKHDGVCPEGSSHKLCKYGKEKIHHFRINKSALLHELPRMEGVVRKLEQVIEEMANYSIASFLVEGDPLCRLELISRMGLRWRDAFVPLPESHCPEPTLKELQEYACGWRGAGMGEVRIEDASEEQNRLLNVQISLLDPTLYLCGECSERLSSREEYITHIYLQHSHIHTLNSHRLLFLLN